MIHQLRAMGKASYDDFGLYIKSRDIPAPSIKKVLESVPYRNGGYDFSRIAGELAYEDLIIGYSFDVADFSVSAVQLEKDKLLTWLNGVFDEDITDDYVAEAHPGAVWHGSLESVAWKEEAGQGLLEARFRCYPFKLLPMAISSFTASAPIVIESAAAHRVSPTIRKTPGVGVITTPQGSFAIPANADVRDSRIELLPGLNTWAAAGSGTITVSYRPEVF